jgi:hypothetical protein
MLKGECLESDDVVMNKVQSELDLLRSSIALENSCWDSMDEAPLHPTVQHCNDTLKDIRLVVGIASGQSSLFCESKRSAKYLSESVDEEILKSYYSINDLNSRLRRRILKEQQRLAFVQSALDEHLEINRALKELKQKAETTASTTNRDQFLYDDVVNNDNTQLHDDLLYISNCIEERFLNKQGTLSTEHAQYKSLHSLILRFIKQRIDSPDHPYLDLSTLTNEFHPKHIQMLREALILESNQKKTDQAALVDYTQNDTHQV